MPAVLLRSMSVDSAFIVALALKMAATAGVVVTASLIAERAGALIGALVATLPIASGPAYILLSLNHSGQFIADSTVTSLAVHAATGAFGTAYVFTAQRGSFLVAIAAAIGTWLGFAFLIRAIDWSLPGAMVLCAATYGICVPLVRRHLYHRVPVVARRWFDVPVRALMVAVLVGTVVTVGANVGPAPTGILADSPSSC